MRHAERETSRPVTVSSVVTLADLVIVKEQTKAYVDRTVAEAIAKALSKNKGKAK
jgi:hypothetical protein